jgi:hypothetical protein
MCGLNNMNAEVMLNSADRVAESNLFMDYALTEFPKLKSQFRTHNIIRCNNCIASTHFSKIKDGICQLCEEYINTDVKKIKHKGQVHKEENTELHDILQAGAGSGQQQYDALVMFSGGKDSTYLVHKLISDYPKLRLLLVTIDSGYASEIALKNTKSIASKLRGVDSMIVRPRPDLFYNAFRHALTNLKPQSCYLTIDLLDGELTFDIGRNLAASMKIPLFIAGTSTAQLRLLHNLDWFERPRDQMLVKRTHTTGGYKIKDLTSSESLHNWWDGTKWPEEQVPRNILPFHAWDYDEEFVQSEVVRLGYLEQGEDNPLATNNILIPLMIKIDFERFGYCGFEPEFALLVREGRANREQWLNIFDAAAHLASTDEFLPLSVDDTLRKLDLSRAEVGFKTALSSSQKIEAANV